MVVDTPPPSFLHHLGIDFLVESRAVRHDVDFAAYHRLDARLRRSLMEFNGAEHHPVIGQRDGAHLVGNRGVDQPVDRGGAVEEAEVRVIMKMDEFGQGKVVVWELGFEIPDIKSGFFCRPSRTRDGQKTF